MAAIVTLVGVPSCRLAEFMSKRLVAVLTLCLLAATAVQAQFSGGHRRGGQGAPQSGAPARGPNAAAPAQRATPVSQVDIIGVVMAIDAAGDRMTIAYQPVEARNWPAGTMPFVVADPALLKTATVGEKVRFRLDSQQIVALHPF